MKYYEILNFQDEPFSNSPDPDFFYESPKHLECLNRLEIALRLKRGLNVVLGDVGTGKTTLCRRLLRALTEDEAIDAHLLLDPDFDNPRDLLLVLCEMLEGETPEAGLTEWSLKERVKNSLFKRGVDENKTTVLIIDEGQKIHDRCMELLRELLNYETNDAKLLQIVIFAQLEFEPIIRRYPNFADRINDLIRLGPLDFAHTRELIDYRINLAKVHMSRTPLFTRGGYWAMYGATRGYPRKIVKLAHKVFLTLILNNDHRATWALVRSVSRENYLAENAKLPAARTEIGASKSLFAPSRTSSAKISTPDADGDDIEGARHPWAAGLAVALLVMLVAVRAETPSNAPLIVGNAANLEAVAEPVVDAPKIETPKSPPRESIFTAAGSRNDSDASSRSGLGVHYRAEIIARNVIPGNSRPQHIPAAPPETLGAVTVAEDVPLAALVRRIYGRAGDDLVALVVAANDSLDTDSVVPSGASVIFPVARGATLTPDQADTGYVVQVGRYETLNAAYDAISAYGGAGQDAPGMAILPQWSGEGGLVFFLVHATKYSDESEALRAMRSRGHAEARTPEILASWEKDAVLLADLGAWKPQQQPETTAKDLFPPPGPIDE
ncbi:hypothetical protein DPQ33_08835 [Oceanidesulfovibrio indonesiensis]|uniref:ORC1/DEAH AAA+ ATPase domain-containing protein n=1 Tax=Oceanidesulfovibrio indonesiensis TaxID=54767 RepID=A0A7M3MEN6_9BACT|nr:AAA family ATPase [Oceanidesulfovibrio indonesiensis]TVM17281.1 hypothetical protein DPQ33_08835 [Oceanidesulfovibrio indonesiensis]